LQALQEREEVMAKKSKSKKSKAKKTKSESPENQSETREALSPSWSTDQVYELLKAVNEVTLKRMEDAINGNRRYIVDLHNKLVNDHLLPISRQLDTTQGIIGDLHNKLVNEHLLTMRREVQAIKAKTDRLP